MPASVNPADAADPAGCGAQQQIFIRNHAGSFLSRVGED
jgi:hypothetical protein